MSSMIIPLGQEVHFDAITSDSAGNVTNADATPTWEVFEEDNDTPMLSGDFTKRSGQTGVYRAQFNADETSGFVVGNFYSVIGDAVVNGVHGKCVCVIFRCGPAEESVAVPNVNLVNVETVVAQGIADEFLDRDMSAGPDSGTQDVRTVRQALRFLRNRWYIDSSGLHVTKEDDDAESWMGELSTSEIARPITGMDPEGGS